MLDPAGIYAKQNETFGSALIKPPTFQTASVAIDTLIIQWLLCEGMNMAQCQIIDPFIFKLGNIDLIHTRN